MNQKLGNDNQSNIFTQKYLEILGFFPSELRQLLLKIPVEYRPKVIEIRLRLNQPLELNFGSESKLVTTNGMLSSDWSRAIRINEADFKRVLNSITAGSIYALESELTQGYFSLPGGHRVGLTGQIFYNNDRIRLIRNISSLNFRIAKPVIGIARPILACLWRENRFLKTLILAPPAAGKTTLLREIVREVSYGHTELGIPGLHVGLVDERSEIAGSIKGVAQLDVGPRTDILDGCSKKDGVYLLLRSMNPDLIATDEIGRETDLAVIEDIINAGVSFIASAHARNLTEAMLRPGLRRILDTGAVERLITLSNRRGVGTIESIKAGISGPEIYPFRTGSKGEEK